jgi:hypothetical protein
MSQPAYQPSADPANAEPQQLGFECYMTTLEHSLAPVEHSHSASRQVQPFLPAPAPPEFARRAAAAAPPPPLPVQEAEFSSLAASVISGLTHLLAQQRTLPSTAVQHLQQLQHASKHPACSTW